VCFDDLRFRDCVCLFTKIDRIKMFRTSKCVRVNNYAYMKTGENVLLLIERKRLLLWKV